MAFKIGPMLQEALTRALGTTESAGSTTPVAHKSTTRAGGLRDITAEAVRPDKSGSRFSLEGFFPDFLKK